MKYSDAEAIPPCEFSAHCVRLLDDLDALEDESALRQGFVRDARDMQDEYLIEKLRVHMPGCPVCSAKVAEARLQRSRQRAALRRYLADAEFRVPSTAERILSMARQDLSEEIEQPSIEQKRQRYMLPEVFFLPLRQPGGNDVANSNGHFDHAAEQQPPAAHQSGRWLRNGFALAAAAVLIFAALGVFDQFLSHHGATILQDEVQSWPSVVVGVSLLSFSRLYNVDTASGKSEQMTPTGISNQDLEYGAVSPDGKDVLYRFSAHGQVIYTTLQLAKSGRVIARAAMTDAGNAIWKDNDHVLVTYARSGVTEYDIHTGMMVAQFAAPGNIRLLFYHAPFLYFQDAQQTAIYRSNLATGAQVQLIAMMSGLHFTHCVLNPAGVGIYCEGQVDRFPRAGNNLYRVNGDGLGVQALSRKGFLLGFAPDHTLLFLQVMFDRYQVVKLGETLQQDRVVMINAAPASAILGTGDALLAPDGHGLVVQVSNASNSAQGVWYDDLTTQTSREVFPYLPGSTGQIIGWDQARVPSSPFPVATAA